jgi:translation initiation factor 2 beta subunit (eIF-2beta)/eIF-5
MECPACGNPHCVEEADEVDIGVGTIRRVYMLECPECGPMDPAEMQKEWEDEQRDAPDA